MKILFFGLKRSLFMAVMAISLGLFSGTAFAHDHEHEDKNKDDHDSHTVVSSACVSFNQAKSYEDELKDHEDELKDDEEAKNHEDEAKKHEDEAKKHEDEAKNFEEHKVPSGATSCTTPSGLPGFLPASATSSTGSKVYREIRGQ